MKLQITESQYRTLLRRLEYSDQIEKEFDYCLKKEPPCGYSSFGSYFSHVIDRTGDALLYKITENDKSIRGNMELLKKLVEEIYHYIKNNMEEYASDYYYVYSLTNCSEF